ncbi:MAG: hypothetical protein M3436_15785 [Pseudomonadota bacterium]|nr:hypothetical protein [Pseudomonadota bacterium]
MSKESILLDFESDLEDPGSLKSGEYLGAHVLAHARSAAAKEKDTLVEVLRDWLLITNEPRTMLAVRVAKELRLRELTPHLENLRNRIETGEAFFPFYLQWVDEALRVLRNPA